MICPPLPCLVPSCSRVIYKPEIFVTFAIQSLSPLVIIFSHRAINSSRISGNVTRISREASHVKKEVMGKLSGARSTKSMTYILPAELIVMMYKLLERCDQACFAITCRYLKTCCTNNQKRSPKSLCMNIVATIMLFMPTTCTRGTGIYSVDLPVTNPGNGRSMPHAASSHSRVGAHPESRRFHPMYSQLGDVEPYSYCTRVHDKRREALADLYLF